MKRLCFDTESGYARRSYGVGTVEERREAAADYVRRHGAIRFDCGVVYDEATCCYHEFAGQQVGDLVALLAGADELINHNGLRHDLLVLEQVCGLGPIASLWKLPHRDLMEVIRWGKLEEHAGEYVSDRSEAVEQDHKARLIEIQNRFPDVTFWSGHKGPPNERFIPEKPAKARRDVELTYAVFREFEVSGRKPARPDPVLESFLYPFGHRTSLPRR